MSSTVEVAAEIVSVMARNQVIRTTDIPFAIEFMCKGIRHFKRMKDKEDGWRKYANGNLKHYLQVDTTCRKTR